MSQLTPAQIVHRDAEIGSLAPGKLADILILDDQVNVKAVYIGGVAQTFMSVRSS